MSERAKGRGTARAATSAAESSPEVARERVLVERAQSGDQQALEELLAMNQDFAYRSALRFTNGREEAAFELAQEVLISAFRHIAKFRGESRFSTWLYRMTANFAKNRWVVENRERSRYVSMEAPRADDESERAHDWADDAVDQRTLAADREALALLREKMADLEPEWREVLELRFFEDMSYEEIADALEVPLGTVKSRINRARAALRAAMKQTLDVPGSEGEE